MGETRRVRQVAGRPASRVRPERRRGFWRRFWKPVSGAAGAVLLAILLIFRDALLPEVFDQHQITDQARDLQGEPDIKVVRVSTTMIGDEGDEFVRPDGYLPSPVDQQSLHNLFGPDFAAAKARVSDGQVLLRKATWQIVLRGNRAEHARVLGMEPVDVRRAPPAGGTIFWWSPQGASDNQMMGVDFDDPQPIVRTVLINHGAAVFQGAYFASKTIDLGDKEDVVLVFRAAVTSDDVSFSLKVDYQVGDRPGSLVVSDVGRPFRVTGIRCADVGEPGYSHYFTFGATPTSGWYPTTAAPLAYLCGSE